MCGVRDRLRKGMGRASDVCKFASLICVHDEMAGAAFSFLRFSEKQPKIVSSFATAKNCRLGHHRFFRCPNAHEMKGASN